MRRSNSIPHRGCDHSPSVVIPPDDAPADLTRITKSNGGEFAKVTEIIKAHAIVAAHGQRTMLVWGRTLPQNEMIEPNEPAAVERAPEQTGALCEVRLTAGSDERTGGQLSQFDCFALSLADQMSRSKPQNGTRSFAAA
jgi:hypothetical protein